MDYATTVNEISCTVESDHFETCIDIGKEYSYNLLVFKEL